MSSRGRRPRLSRTGVVALVAGSLTVAAVAMVVAAPGPALVRLLPGVTYVGDEGVVRQLAPVDCAVAALEMVYRDLGRDGEMLAEARARVVGRNRGLTLLEMRELAVDHGLTARGWRFEERTVRGLADLGLPVVAHVRNHFVVVDRLGEGWIEIRDPSAGRLRVSDDAFRLWWTGNVLSIGEPPPG